MTTTARWRALRWFADHAADINKVMGRRQPSGKMRKLMIRDGQLQRVPVGGFGHAYFVLTEQGWQLLAGKHKRKKLNKEEDHDDDHRDNDERQRQAADWTEAGAGE